MDHPTSPSDTAHLDFAQDLSRAVIEATKRGLHAYLIAQILIRTGRLVESMLVENSADLDPDPEEYDPRLGVAELPFTPEELAKNTPNHDPSDLII